MNEALDVIVRRVLAVLAGAPLKLEGVKTMTNYTPPAPGDPVRLDCPKPRCGVRFTLAAIVVAAPPTVTCPSCRGAFVAPEGSVRV